MGIKKEVAGLGFEPRTSRGKLDSTYFTLTAFRDPNKDVMIFSASVEEKSLSYFIPIKYMVLPKVTK